MKQRSVLLALFILATTALFAQTKTIIPYTQFWTSYNNQTRLTNKIGLWGDFHLRTKDHFFDDLSSTIARVGVMYYLNDATKLTAGYAYITNYPMEGTVRINQPEHRPWQQLQWHTNYAKTKTMQWIRLEERYRRNIANDSMLRSGTNFNFRLRYNLFYEIPFTSKGTPTKWSFFLNDEVHINFGKNIVNNYFDQNRFFIGFKYNVSKTDNVQFGYTNVFQQLPAGNRYRNSQVLRVNYFQNLDLRKKK
jgi:hypothetical protein